MKCDTGKRKEIRKLLSKGVKKEVKLNRRRIETEREMEII